MLKQFIYISIPFIAALSSCKTAPSTSAALSYPDGYETFCGDLSGYTLTTSPSMNKYILEPADGATDNIIKSLNDSEVCVTADYSFKDVIVRSAHYIVPKYETLCGTLTSAELDESGAEGLFNFTVGSDQYMVEAGDGAVLNSLTAKINTEVCLYADFRGEEVIIESMASIKEK